MNVRQLADRLTRLVEDGRGGDEVFVSLFADDITAAMQDVLDRHNWHVTAVDRNDGRSGFVGLECRPDPN